MESRLEDGTVKSQCSLRKLHAWADHHPSQTTETWDGLPSPPSSINSHSQPPLQPPQGHPKGVAACMVPWRQPLFRMIRLVTPWGEECQEKISRTAGNEKSFPLTSSQAISQLFGGPYQEHVRDLTKCGQGGKSSPVPPAGLG